MDSIGTVSQRVIVRFDYPVVFTRDVFAPDNDAFVRAVTRLEPHRRHRLLVVIDAGVAAGHPELEARLRAYVRRHAEWLELVEEPLVVVGGEHVKNDLAFVPEMQQRFSDHRLDRQSFAVVIGGGALLDAVGFAASTVHRGLRTIRLPTTVLAQNDAGIGVKNGVNAQGSKNYFGTFHPPFAVLNDFDFLSTLNARDARAGFAEAIKVALLRDPAFFGWLEAHAAELASLQPEPVAQLVRRCAELHLQHIADSGDPFELGSARPLDFGHWSAHKLETLSHHALRHGEAVAIGIRLDCRYAALVGQLDPAAEARIGALLDALELPAHHPALAAREGDRFALLGGLQEFREHLGGELALTLLHDIGRPMEVHAMDEALLERALTELCACRPPRLREADG